MSRTHRGLSDGSRVLLPAIVMVMLVIFGAVSSATTAGKAWAQGQQQQPQAAQSSTSGGDIKSKAKEVENTVISALKSYATAIGARYIELDFFNRTQMPPASANNTGAAPTIVNQTAYTDAQNMITKAQDQLQSLLQTSTNTPQQSIQIAKIQGGVEALKALIESKAPFNLAEDIVQSPIVNNLRQIS